MIGGVPVKEKDSAIIANIRNIGNVKVAISSDCFYFIIFRRSILNQLLMLFCKLLPFIKISFLGKKNHIILHLPYMPTNPPMTKMHTFPCSIEPKNF